MQASSGEVSKKELFVGSFQIYERGPMLEAAAIPAGEPSLARWFRQIGLKIDALWSFQSYAQD